MQMACKGELPPANHATLGLEGGARFRRKWEGERSDVCRGQFSFDGFDKRMNNTNFVITTKLFGNDSAQV